jgi:hypothetical protein
MLFAENIKSGVYASTHLHDHKAVCTCTINTISLLEVLVLALLGRETCLVTSTTKKAPGSPGSDFQCSGLHCPQPRRQGNCSPLPACPSKGDSTPHPTCFTLLNRRKPSPNIYSVKLTTPISNYFQTENGTRPSTNSRRG